MKNLIRIATATLAATLLLGAGASGAMAQKAPAPPVQQSNIQPSLETLTEEVILSGPTPVREHLDVSKEESNFLRQYEYPYPASAPIAAADGSLWRIVRASVDSKYAKFWYIPEAAVLTSNPAGTFDAAAEIASAATQVASDSHFKQFDGRGTVKAGAGWHSNDDTTTPPLAVASGLGFEAEMSEPYESNGQQIRKISLYADGSHSTAYVLDADVINYTASEEPTEEPTITAAEKAPAEMPAVPEGMEAVTSNEPGNDQPGNLGLMVGVGALVMATGGGYLYWSRRKSAGGATVVASAPVKFLRQFD